jgi:hypothetical protein
VKLQHATRLNAQLFNDVGGFRSGVERREHVGGEVACVALGSYRAAPCDDPIRSLGKLLETCP